MSIFSALRNWRKLLLPYTPLVEIKISKEALLHNYGFYREQGAQSVAPVLKSNAYGHGLLEVARVMDTTDAPFLVVDSLYEAIVLRRGGIKKPILVIGYTTPENIARVKLRHVAFMVTSVEHLHALCAQVRRPVHVHMKIDTGMNRQGILPAELDEALSVIQAHPHITLAGIFSHFAETDTPGAARTTLQLARWRDVLARTKATCGNALYYHIAATAGVGQLLPTDSNVMRLGVGLYGIDPSGRYESRLRPALSVFAPITAIKHVGAGAFVGYGDSFQAGRDMTIATLPLGYFEGIDRHLSSKGVVMLGDHPCAIVGRVSMNITTIDISGLSDIRVGDRVLVLGGARALPCSIESAAATAGTISYELLVHIPQHLRRTLV